MPLMTLQSSRFEKVMSFGHVKFEGSVRHSHGDVKQTGFKYLKFRREACARDVFIHQYYLFVIL